jgi:uncharacterized protein (DUF1015 family)
MSVVRPFRALRYAPRFGSDLSALITPPYDVISPERRAAYAARHPNNIVHLDLPGGGEAPAGEALDPYRRASDLLRMWRRQEVLVRDDRPALHVCTQTYRDPAGRSRTRRGFFARLQLEPLEAGTIIPHEKTLERPRADRTSLLRSTRTHLSAVFLLHPDPGGKVSRLIGEAASAPPLTTARDDEGTESRLVRLADEERIGPIVEALGAGWALIADGHHRYESALAYRDERRAAGTADAESILACFCSLEDPGLSIFPIHRLVYALPRFDPAAFRARLTEHWSLEPVGDLTAAETALERGRGRPGTFAFLFAGEEGATIVRWKEGAGLDCPGMTAVPEPLRRLDVILLHRLVLEGLLDITPEAQVRQENLDYAKDAGELERRVRSGAAQIGILMNPTRIEQVIEVSRAGLRLPQKSTYFYPKILTGLVLDPLDT